MSHRSVLTIVLVLSILILASTASAQTAGTAMVRLVHAVPGAPAVDFLIDGALAAPALGYTEYTNYLHVTGGTHTLSVQVGGAAVAETSFVVGEGQALTIAVMGTAAAPELNTLDDDLSPLVLGNSRLTAVHAASGTDAVDVVFSDGSPLLPALSYGASSGGIDIPANVYPMAVVPTGGSVSQALIPATDYALRSGMLYRLLILGGDAGALLLETPVSPEGEAVQVRVAHAIPGAPAVDVYANETLLIPSLAAGNITQYVALPLDTYDVALRTAGADSSTAPIAALSLDLSDISLASQARTVVAVNEGGALGLAVVDDDTSDLAASSARINVFNAVAGAAVTVSLDDGTEVASNLAFESASASVSVPAGVYTFTAASDSGGEASSSSQGLNGGVVYSVIVTGTPEQPELVVGELAINQQPGSAAVAGAPSAPEATEEAVEEAEVLQATPVPTQPPPPAATQVPVTPAEGPIALVNLQPGANLQLREYPNEEARSFGLAPAGTILVVQGRAGEPDFVGFVELPEEEDLDPTQVWISAIYNTPDGGAITAWVRAEFLEITEEGFRIRLVELDPLPSDVAGEVINTAITPPQPPREEFYGVIINLDPGVNLHIRRTPETIGESLIRLPVGTPVEVVGILEDYSWTLIRFSPPEGGSVTGWAFTDYVKFVFNGEEFYPTAEEIDELFLLEAPLNFADDAERGEISGESGAQLPAPAQPAPAQQAQPQQPAAPAQTDFTNQIVATTLLDVGASLHLRRTPDTDGESLALIPNAVTMAVLGRTADNNWLLVSYDGTDGWIASDYVELRLNGQRVDLLEVPEAAP